LARNLVIFILLSACSINIFSQEKEKLLFPFGDEYYYYDKFEKNINASWRFLTPPLFGDTWGFVGLSAGIGYEIIPRFYYIGIAGDVALGFAWLALSSDDNNKKDDKIDKDSQIGISIGGRIYNVLQINNFKIWPFFGCDFFFIILPMPYVGAELSYKIIGFEYAYFLPIYKEVIATRHRISIKFHLPN
jgi:hypothetical protein